MIPLCKDSNMPVFSSFLGHLGMATRSAHTDSTPTCESCTLAGIHTDIPVACAEDISP